MQDLSLAQTKVGIGNKIYLFILDYRPGTGVVIMKGAHLDMCGKVSHYILLYGCNLFR